MNWQTLFHMQAKLDEYIEQNHGVQKEGLTDKKILALLVEVGELANETRCFKFWSKKQPSGKETILEEFVDGIHFLMSIGLDKSYHYSGYPTHVSGNDLTAQFTVVFSAIASFQQEPSENNFKRMFTSYLQLGSMLGFETEEIQAAYMEKNETNYQRQDNGY